jgi:hypothetical protein
MKKSAPDKGFLINIKTELYHKEICGICHRNAMLLNRGITVLNEISHIVKTGIPAGFCKHTFECLQIFRRKMPYEKIL